MISYITQQYIEIGYKIGHQGQILSPGHASLRKASLHLQVEESTSSQFISSSRRRAAKHEASKNSVASAGCRTPSRSRNSTSKPKRAPKARPKRAFLKRFAKGLPVREAPRLGASWLPQPQATLGAPTGASHHVTPFLREASPHFAGVEQGARLAAAAGIAKVEEAAPRDEERPKLCPFLACNSGNMGLTGSRTLQF